jgi:glycine cleavage system H lipoate-binding protein
VPFPRLVAALTCFHASLVPLWSTSALAGPSLSGSPALGLFVTGRQPLHAHDPRPHAVVCVHVSHVHNSSVGTVTCTHHILQSIVAPRDRLITTTLAHQDALGDVVFVDILDVDSEVAQGGAYIVACPAALSCFACAQGSVLPMLCVCAPASSVTNALTASSSQTETCGAVESVKAVSEIYSPLTGVVSHCPLL